MHYKNLKCKIGKEMVRKNSMREWELIYENIDKSLYIGEAKNIMERANSLTECWIQVMKIYLINWRSMPNVDNTRLDFGSEILKEYEASLVDVAQFYLHELNSYLGLKEIPTAILKHNLQPQRKFGDIRDCFGLRPPVIMCSTVWNYKDHLETLTNFNCKIL